MWLLANHHSSSPCWQSQVHSNNQWSNVWHRFFFLPGISFFPPGIEMIKAYAVKPNELQDSLEGSCDWHSGIDYLHTFSIQYAYAYHTCYIVRAFISRRIVQTRQSAFPHVLDHGWCHQPMASWWSTSSTRVSTCTSLGITCLRDTVTQSESAMADFRPPLSKVLAYSSLLCAGVEHNTCAAYCMQPVRIQVQRLCLCCSLSSRSMMLMLTALLMLKN